MKRLIWVFIIFALLLQNPIFVLGEAGSRIVATPECIIFYTSESGGNPASQAFRLSNGGSGTLNYALAATAPWVTINKNSGSVTTGEDTITVSVDAAGLSESQSPYISDIAITDADEPANKKIIKVRLSVISPESYGKAYAYDQNGNLARRVTPNRDVIEYKYDKLNQLTNIYYPDGSNVSYTYDSNGNRASMTDKSGATRYVYDAYGRLEAVYFPNINPVIYTYDKTGNIIKIEYPDRSTISYVYNADNKLENVSDATGITAYVYYSGSGLLYTKTLPNNVITTYTYDGAKRITNVDNRGAGGALISTYVYGYDPNGNITSVVETTPSGAKTTAYGYDKLNRLITVNYPDERGIVTYEYDAAGNRLKMVTPQGATNYKYDADNRLIRAGKEIFFYDNSGNLIKKISPTETVTYGYDYDNRLIRYQDNTGRVEFEYDGDGRRISKTVNGEKTNYVNDILRNPVQVIIEADVSWRVKKIYRYGLDRLSQEEF